MNPAIDALNTELLDANTLLRTVIDENPNIILMKDWDGKFLIGNRALADLYGTTTQDLVGKDDGAFNPNAEQVDFYLKNVREIMSQSQTQVVMEESTNANTGEVSYYQSIKKPILTAQGTRQILVIANDVSELKQVQKRLEESERRLRYVLDATREGIWDWDIATGLVTHNLQWCRLIGVDDEHLTHPLERFSALLHEADKPQVFEKLNACLRGESRYQSEHRMRLQDGRVVWVLDRGDVVERDALGAPLRMVGSCVDISERKSAELALGLQTELLNSIFELSPDGFISFDAQGRVSYASPAFTRLTGIPVARLQGLDEQEFGALLAPLCAAQGEFPGFARLRHSAGSATTGERERMELAGAGKRMLEVGLRTGSTSAVSQILFFRDVTHETEVEQMKSEFLSTAAHELRTPMASIYGFAEVLLTQDLDARSRAEFLSIIFRQSELMASILNELLDLARIEARRGKDFVIQPTSVQTLVRDVVAGFKPPAGRSAPRLDLSAATLSILADQSKASQALLNVLANAYKYSASDACVCISVCAPLDAETGAESGQIAIRITDAGIGMTPEQIARVCERFYRADSSGAVPGTGLGMSIVQEIVELHHGSLHIASQLGQGTCVTLSFPSGPPQPGGAS
jgi:PAS domain S-box-containing protein